MTPTEDVLIDVGRVALPGLLDVPEGAGGVVVFAHGSGSCRLSPRNRQVAGELQEAGFATLLFDLLTEEEAADRRNVFDVPLLADRLGGAARWAGARPELGGLPFGLFGASTGAAAALVAASRGDAAAVVSRGGRVDMAEPILPRVTCPSLFIVGERDHQVLELNRAALRRLGGEGVLEVVEGAGHLFEEPGALEEVARLARDWFARHLAGR